MKRELKEIIEKFQGKRIVVWGDFMLDEYIYTSTSRISREAPVLVTEYEFNELRLGGAGNVVTNIKALGAVPIPAGFIGKNAEGDALKKLLDHHSIITDFIIELDDYRTPKKSRILSGGENTKKQQVLRIDTINRSEINPNAYKKIENLLSDLLIEIDFLVISDYIYKSVNADILKRIQKTIPGTHIILDSRNHLTKFKNISIATPNEPEIKQIFPQKNFYTENDFYEAGRDLLERLNARGIILKRGQKGMLVFEKDTEPKYIPIHGSVDIVDETGAGDTVISVVGLSLSTGANLFSSAVLANIAAGFVVMKEGAYPIRRDELENELK